MSKAGTQGFTLVEIMIVVTIIGLLAMMAIPSFVRARETAQDEMCINNIKQLFAAKELWALEYNIGGNVGPTPEQIDPYIKGGTAKCLCPQDGAQTFETSYTIGTLKWGPYCKINEEHNDNEFTEFDPDG